MSRALDARSVASPLPSVVSDQTARFVMSFSTVWLDLHFYFGREVVGLCCSTEDSIENTPFTGWPAGQLCTAPIPRWI